MDPESQHLTPPPRKDPLEERSLAPLVLGLTLALLAFLAWAVYDETVTRRPWKAYQLEYARQASKLLDREIGAEKKRIETFLESPRGKALLRARAKARRAFAAGTPLGDKVRSLRKRLGETRARISRLRARSREANGEKLQLLSRGLSSRDPRVETLSKKLDALGKKLLEAGDREEALLAELDRVTTPLRRAERPLSRLRAHLKQLQKTRDILAGFSPRVEQVYLKDFGRVERCLTCHIAMKPGMPGLKEAPFRSHPGDYLVRHPPGRFGCVVCHEGYGRALDDLAAPHGFDPSYPREILRGSAAQGRCGSCHRVLDGRDRTTMRGELPGAPALSLGLKAFERNLCHGCHATPGFPRGTHLAPPLAEVPAKLGFKNTLSWIRDPSKIRKNARMPTFHLDRQGEDAYALASYIFSLPRVDPEPLSWPAFLKKKEDDMSDRELDELDALLERGRKTWSRVQCADCHPREGKGGDAGVYAPDLSNAGARLGRNWIYRWLENPHALFPEGRMPRIGLSDGQIRGLVESILRDPEFGGGDEDEGEPGEEEGASPASGASKTPAGPSRDPAILERGRKLVMKLGCAGCHDIPGHGEDPPAGSDLSNYGDKKLEDLDFGPRRDIPKTVESWTILKLQDPRTFGEELFMPRPHLTPLEARAITAFLLGLTAERPPAGLRPALPYPFRAGGRAWRILQDRRCLTCHSLGRRGGDFAPELDFEGSRVRPAWLEGFLKEPTSIRPRLIQMPQLLLPAGEIRTLSRFFQYACRKDALESLPPPGKGALPGPEEGAALLEGGGCLACHTWGPRGGILGADIQKAKERLRPGFVYHWILDPRGADRDSLCPRSGMSPDEAARLARFLAGGEKP